MVTEDIRQKTYELIDSLKATCQQFGMGNDGNEYKIITQIFLYKFLNDKFGYEIKKISKKIRDADKWEVAYSEMKKNEREDLFDSLSPDVPRLYPEHLISNLWNQQSKGDFDLIFDQTMVDIANKNIDIFSTQTTQNTKIPLFEKLTIFVTDEPKRVDFARALVDKLVNFSFEEAFDEHYDFFAAIFEYLIKDYNTAGGGKYAEYYTPHSIATIMAKLLVGDARNLHNIECYDPSAGTGTLLMALAHQIGEDKCTIYSQDISQKSNKMLKLNLILNNLVPSLDHAIQGDTLTSPYHKSDNREELRTFDFIVSNPPFNLDFSDTRNIIAAMPERFWAGIPTVPPKKKDSMAIYTCFIQHVINSLKPAGKGAIVVPTGFITAQSSIEKNIRKKLIENRWLKGVISMPSNIFANTGTNVSVLFIDKTNNNPNASIMLIDATALGEQKKIGNLKKTILRPNEIDLILDSFLNEKPVDDFSAKVTYQNIKDKYYSFAAGQYFKVELKGEKLSKQEFESTILSLNKEIKNAFSKGRELEKKISAQLEDIKNELS